MNCVLSWITFFPLLGILAILFVPKGKDDIVKWISVGVTLIPLLLAIKLTTLFNYSAGGFQFVEKALWIPSLNVEFHMGIDGMSFLMVLLATL
ncbi:MAG: NADH-quinone oxidoreductase subunit M, partial [bacterium]